MKLIKGQLSLFDDYVLESEEDESGFTILEFDRLFRVGSRFLNGTSVVELTNIRRFELYAEIKNVTLEDKGLYVGSRYYINKESYGKFYFAFADNGNLMPCPYID